MTRRLLILMLMACAGILAQQQLLLRRPPRLIRLMPQQVQSGTAALDLQFSRPMNRASVSEATRLAPAVPHQWLGETTPLRMVIDADVVLKAPIQLSLAGQDQRALMLEKQQWWWEPRPWLIATRPVPGGEQVQLQTRSGGWIPISRVWPAIPSVVPLGNGRGIALVGRDQNGTEQVWWDQLTPRNTASSVAALGPPTVNRTKPLLRGEVLFAHLSSNLNGDLLVQSGGFQPGSDQALLVQANGKRQRVVNAVALEDETIVELTLKNEIPPAFDAILVSYRDLKGDQRKGVIQDLSGNDAEGFKNAELDFFG